MKYLLVLLLVSNSFAQRHKLNDNSIIKRQIERHYAAYQQEKDELLMHIETGFDKAGNQIYFIDHLAAKKDTVYEFSKNVQKKVGKKTCYYNEKGEILICRNKKKRIIMLYFPPNLKQPVSYELYDKKGMFGGIYKTNHKNYPYKKAFLTKRKYDEHGNPTYYIVTEYYLPKGFDPKNRRARKILEKGLIQAEKSKIIEYNYTYFE